jgi:hypothetical protein
MRLLGVAARAMLALLLPCVGCTVLLPLDNLQAQGGGDVAPEADGLGRRGDVPEVEPAPGPFCASFSAQPSFSRSDLAHFDDDSRRRGRVHLRERHAGPWTMRYDDVVAALM